MRAVLILFVLSFVGYSAANFNAKVNSLIDFEFDVVNKLLTKENMTYVPLGSYKTHDWDVTESWMGDLSTFHRIGDATVEAVNDNTLMSNATYGLQKLYYGMKQMSNGVDTYNSVIFVSDGGSATVSYSISFDDQGSCSIVWNEYYIDFGTVKMYVETPAIQGADVTAHFKTIQDSVNAYYRSDKFRDILAKSQPCSITFGASLYRLISLWQQ